MRSCASFALKLITNLLIYYNTNFTLEIIGVGLDNSTLPLPPMYNKYELPTYSVEFKDNPEEVLGVTVHVTLFIRSILDVDTKAEVSQ